MKNIFLAVFESVWKRKETKIFLAFSFYPLVYLAASFFGESNFMQIANADGSKVAYIDFADMMLNSMDMMILPTLALYFLTISVFRRETDDHTMFLYKDIDRKSIYFSKYFSLLLILSIYFALFFASSLLVHYTRVVHMEFGTTQIVSDTLYYTLLEMVSIFTVFLKGVLAISVASFASLRSGTGTTMTIAIVLTVTMMILSAIGGPIAALLPTGYQQFMQTVENIWIGLVGPVTVTAVYGLVLNTLSIKKFKSLEF